jgi:hypothetical protein
MSPIVRARRAISSTHSTAMMAQRPFISIHWILGLPLLGTSGLPGLSNFSHCREPHVMPF